MNNCVIDNFEDNSELRSEYMFNVIFRNEREKVSTYECNSSIPRRIVQYWDTNPIPKDVEEVMNSWKESGLSITIFNKNSALEFIKDNFEENIINAFNRCCHPAMRSDYFRLCFLYLEGGLYVDADDKYNGISIDFLFENNNLKLNPLCYDKKNNEMIDLNNFYYENNFNHDYIYYINNNPLIAPKRHRLIEIAFIEATKNLLNEKTNFNEIQSVAGPGNISACIVRYTLECKALCLETNYELLTNWDEISKPFWGLEYRFDKRNWRNWLGEEM